MLERHSKNIRLNNQNARNSLFNGGKIYKIHTNVQIGRDKIQVILSLYKPTCLYVRVCACMPVIECFSLHSHSAARLSDSIKACPSSIDRYLKGTVHFLRSILCYLSF